MLIKCLLTFIVKMIIKIGTKMSFKAKEVLLYVFTKNGNTKKKIEIKILPKMRKYSVNFLKEALLITFLYYSC